MREAMPQYVKRVQELAEHVRGNEQATKQSLVGPLFTMLGYDLTDPRECIPEYRVDFGPNRSIKPIDWAFLQSGHPIFFVEAKEVGKKLANSDEQLPPTSRRPRRPGRESSPTACNGGSSARVPGLLETVFGSLLLTWDDALSVSRLTPQMPFGHDVRRKQSELTC